jgi:hypothetical protein
MELAGTFNSRCPRPVVLALVGTIGVGLSMAVAIGIAGGHVWFPGCGLMNFADIPCPGCGATRSLALMAEGRPLAALEMNPLVSLLAAAGLFAGPAAWVAARSRRVAEIRGKLGLRGFNWIAGGLVFANWMYLVFVY